MISRSRAQYTHYNELQHTATYWNTPPRRWTQLYLPRTHSTHTATHCNTPPNASTRLRHNERNRISLARTIYTLQQTATHCNKLQHTATYYNKLQHTATNYNKLQHTATYYNTPATRVIERTPPPRGGFLFTMFPHQEPCVRGPRSKGLYQVLRGGSSYTRFLMREHSK